MEKKESLKKENAGVKPAGAKEAGAGGKSKFSAITGGVFGIIKFVLGICLLPFVYSSTVSFLNQINTINPVFQNCFWSGVITFLAIYLFVYEPAILYTKSQKILEVVFGFFAPLVKVAPYVLPIYTVIIFLAYLILSLMMPSENLLRYTMFLLGFSIALHLVFGAKTLRSKQGDMLKANYIFGFSFIYIVDLIIIALCFNAMVEKYSFVGFFNSAFTAAGNIFYAVIKQLFVPK